MTFQKHFWTYEEDKHCCQKFIEYYIVNKRNTSINSFVEMLNNNLPNITSNSLKMKLQNIKQISFELDLKNTLECTRLKNYSNQNFQAMKEVLEENNIKY